MSKIGYSINSVYCDQIAWINHAQFFIFDGFGFKPCSEWLAVFSNPLMGSAAMDRLVHRGIKIIPLSEATAA